VERDFTLAKYASLLRTLGELGIPVYSIQRWIEEKPARGIVLRHDVDRKASNSLRMACLEHDHGVVSTYYFRITKGAFRPEIIREVASLGHEIGYHYEDYARAQGDVGRALECFGRHLTMLREHADIRTIAMHGSPLSAYDNRDLWKAESFDRFGIIGEAFVSIDYSDTYYFTDSGRTWAETGANLRDRVETRVTAPAGTTDELCAFLKQYPSAKVALIAHPERWEAGIVRWWVQYAMDTAVNFVKRGLRVVRGMQSRLRCF
jgi:hypothetical protein